MKECINSIWNNIVSIEKKKNNNFFSSFCEIYFQDSWNFYIFCIFHRVNSFCVPHYVGAGVFDISKNLRTHVSIFREWKCFYGKWINTTMLIKFNNNQLKYLLQFLQFSIFTISFRRNSFITCTRVNRIYPAICNTMENRSSC